MKIVKLGFALLSAACVGSTTVSHAADWDFSGTFANGLKVTGSFLGNSTDGGLHVYDISDVSVSFNDVALEGPFTVLTLVPGIGWPATGAVASSDDALNNFNFVSASGVQFACLPSAIAGYPYDFVSYASSTSLDESPAPLVSWSLVDPPSAVPEGGSTAILFGMSLGMVGWLRRKFA